MTLSTDPVCFARLPSGDLEIPMRLVSGLEAVRIGVRERLLTFAGEWFLDLDHGVPYLPTEDGRITERDAILGQHFDDLKIRAALRRAILSTPNVSAIVELRVSFDGAARAVSAQWRARTSFGDLDDTMQVVT